ncbi:MAG: DEAD/DEAH box helicase [Bacteroidia bacterium]
MSEFSALGLKPELVAAVTELGFTQPTPVQMETIPLLINNETDLVALARTGTGKTAAFGLPLLHRMDPSIGHVQVLVLSPTRELCVQIAGDLKQYSAQLRGTRIAAVYGGSSISTQIRDLRGGAQIVAGTPGRLIDLIERGALKLGNVQIVVLDEADEMLNMGFRDDIDRILAETPESKNTWLFSATMPKEVARIAKNYMTNPAQISVKGDQAGEGSIAHQYVVVHARDRYAALRRLVDMHPDIYGIVFCRTKIETQEVAEHLMRDGYPADALHGDLSQSQRDYVMKRFRSRSLQILVATDVAARGIDVDDITHVFHYQAPDDPASYTHRSGRTGRAGRSGISILLLHMKETGKLRELERTSGKRLELITIPSGEQVVKQQLLSFFKRLKETETDEKAIAPYLPAIHEALGELDPETLFEKLTAHTFKRLLDDYRRAPDLNVQVRGSKGERERGNDRFERRERNEAPQIEGDKVSFFFSIGRMDGIDPGEYLRLLCDQLNVGREHIGRIDLKHNFSFVETIGLDAKTVVESFKTFKYKGRPIRVNEAENKPEGSWGGGDREERPAGGFASKYGDKKRSYGGGEKREGGSGFGGGKKYGGSDRDSGGFGKKKSFGKSWGEKSSGGSGGGGDRSSKFGKKKW